MECKVSERRRLAGTFEISTRRKSAREVPELQ
jgi:hypothetical protein